VPRTTYSLDWEFLSPYPLGKGAHPDHAIARVTVKRFHKAKGGPSLITHDCLTFRELKLEIERLHKELERIKKEANKTFSLHDKREEQWGRKCRNNGSS
jgi:hypothetical protein